MGTLRCAAGLVMVDSLPSVVIVGRPNVGKSTLFNRVVGKRVAVVEDEPGVTRDRLYAEAEWRGKRFHVVDTGGILFGDDDPLIEQIRVQAEVALQEAAVVLFLTEATTSPTADDWELANRLRSSRSPVFVVVNKVDSPQREAFASEYFELGIGEVRSVSALHGSGVADLLDEVAELLPEVPEGTESSEVRIAILGRPNVGKSSLLNAFTGEKRAIVSNLPGTTRDAIDTLIRYADETIRLVDTAGIRRRGKIQGSVEYYMVHRAARSLDRSDCAIVVVDAEEGLTDGDKRVAKMSHDEGKALVVVANKWDLIEPELGRPAAPSDAKKHFVKTLRNEMPEIDYAPVLFTSAEESWGLEPILDAALAAIENWNFRISTGRLNRLMQEAVFAKPLTRKGRPVKLYYSTQVSTRPPTFALFFNDADLVHFSYQNYLLNQVRKEYPLVGTPVRLRLRSSHDKKSD
ncbi:MAG TPA: ribosome biogenesis GTPase Der [Fimbriimonadaceae bacterium]|nr:ribosome biogenesis GTPase Der [Fimbriimonadaceae bacterium]